MESYIFQVQSTITPKLKEIAFPSRARYHHDRQNPGFGYLLQHWNLIYEGVSRTISSSRQRVATIPAYSFTTAPVEQQPTPPAKPASAEEPKIVNLEKKIDEVSLSPEEFNFILQHMRNSWEEQIVGDEIQYINVLDQNKKTWVRPLDAYIRKCARPSESSTEQTSAESTSPLRRGSYERCSPSASSTSSWPLEDW